MADWTGRKGKARDDPWPTRQSLSRWSRGGPGSGCLGVGSNKEMQDSRARKSRGRCPLVSRAEKGKGFVERRIGSTKVGH